MTANIEIKKYMVVVINTNKEYTTNGALITRKMFDSFEDAQSAMYDYCGKFKGREKEGKGRDSIVVEYGDYFVQGQIFDCSQNLTITV